MSHENIVDNSTTTVKTDESSTIDVRSYAQGAAKRDGRTPDYGNFPVGKAKKNFPLARFARQFQRWRIRFSCFIHQKNTRVVGSTLTLPPTKQINFLCRMFPFNNSTDDTEQ